MVNFLDIQTKWQKKWEDNDVFKVEVNDYKKKKYYITTPYAYMSGLLHLGHLFNYTFPEVLSRFKRMQGHNVLFKWGFHCTGTPIVAAAKRVAEGEEKQIAIMKQLGILDKDISKFADPEYWIKYFPIETLKDIKGLGFSIDERYTFITTSKNKPYDSFIKWQFDKLKEKGYVKKGRHPVVWCPKDKTPVGDHARSEGEGETPQEFCLFKFKLDDGRNIITATIRPDTVMGITNVYVNPEVEYKIIETKNETWIVGKSIIEKLKNQEFDLKEIGSVSGKELVGKKVKSYSDSEILVLPATFLDAEYGTGMVHSVPSDSADDLIALKDLQKDDKFISKYGLDITEVKAIKPIGIFNTPEIGENSAQFFLDKYKVKNQNERVKLDKIKKELYKLTLAKSTFNKLYDGFGVTGKLINKGQNTIKQKLLDDGAIELFYELTGKVVCRCLTECNVKIVSNQWFLEYNDPQWKKITHECLDGMTIFPQIVKKQFDYVIDWLNHWACARGFGLGTKLPWDNKWVIESLSDSTLQMAYNTISKYLEHPKDYGFDVSKLNNEFFDFVFLAKGNVSDVSKSTGIDVDMINKMKDDFEYWYPYDFRNSAKDLVQNHLTFSLFNHTAIWDKKYWPKAYSVNGRVMVNNEKMSKSKGNFFTARELYKKYSSDIVRITSANSGEGIDDANFDMDFLDTSTKKINELYDFVSENYNKGRENIILVDDWFESVLHDTIKETTEHMENVRYKSALLKGFLDLQRHLKWYTRRTDGSYNKQLIQFYIETQIKLLTPFTPHICEEMWELIGGDGFCSNAAWPQFDKSKINVEFEQGEKLVSQIMSDIVQVLKLANIEKPKKITIIISLKWKYDFMNKMSEVLSITRDFKEIIGEVMQGELKQYGKDITKLIPKYIKAGSVSKVSTPEFEMKIIESSKEFLSKQYDDCKITVVFAKDSKEGKAKNAMPNKPALLVE